MNQINYIQVLPEVVLAIFGIAVMMLDPLMPAARSRRSLGWLAFAGTLAALAASFYQAYCDEAPGTGWFGMVRVDEFSIFFHVLLCAISSVIILCSLEYLDAEDIRAGEYYALILFGTVGSVLMSTAVELVLVFIGIEISSISSYV